MQGMCKFGNHFCGHSSQWKAGHNSGNNGEAGYNGEHHNIFAHFSSAGLGRFWGIFGALHQSPPLCLHLCIRPMGRPCCQSTPDEGGRGLQQRRHVLQPGGGAKGESRPSGGPLTHCSQGGVGPTRLLFREGCPPPPEEWLWAGKKEAFSSLGVAFGGGGDANSAKRKSAGSSPKPTCCTYPPL